MPNGPAPAAPPTQAPTSPMLLILRAAASAPSRFGVPIFAAHELKRSAAASAAMTAPGYLDPAAPANVFRLRFDSEYHIDRPDRAEFFYAKSGLLSAAAASMSW